MLKSINLLRFLLRIFVTIRSKKTFSRFQITLFTSNLLIFLCHTMDINWKLHSLFDYSRNPPLRNLVYVKVLNGIVVVLSCRQIDGNKIFPGKSYLNLLRELSFGFNISIGQLFIYCGYGNVLIMEYTYFAYLLLSFCFISYFSELANYFYSKWNCLGIF